jgi:hypothetical protein
LFKARPVIGLLANKIVQWQSDFCGFDITANLGVNTMREVKSKLSIIWGVILGTSIVCSTALAQSTGPITTNAIAGPLPPPVMPPNEIKLTPVEQLGKFMLYDHTR